MPEGRSRHRALRFGPLEAFIVLALAVAGTVAWRSDSHAKGVVSREQQALAFARRLVQAEQAFRAQRRRDLDGDGTAEFGPLAELVAAGLVDGPVAKDDDAEHLRRGGYRFEVLLPDRETPKGLKSWSRSGGPVDPRLATTTFAVVALPSGGEAPALRAFYLDGLGYGYSADGVYSAHRESTASPPLLELRGTEKGDDGGRDDGPAWRPFEKPAS